MNGFTWGFFSLVLFSTCLIFPQSAKEREKAWRDLTKAGQDRDPEKFLEALEAVLEGDAVRALPRILDAFSNFEFGKRGMEAGDYYRFHSAAARRLGKLDKIAEVNEMKKLLKNYKNWQGRLLILDAAAGFRGAKSDSYDIAIEALTDSSPVVLRRALIYLKKVEDLKTVDAILSRYLEIDAKESLKGEDWDRARLAFADALAAMLKIQLAAAVDYQNYLSTRREQPDLFNPAEKSGSGKTSLRLFGMEITGKNIVFVLDISGSMMATDPIEIIDQEDKKPKTEAVKKNKVGEEEGGKAEAGKKKVEPEIVTERRRITRARKELVKVIRALPDSIKINLISYSSEVTPWKKKLTVCSAEARKEAIGFVEGLQANGITVTDVALEAAFEDLSIDTIYLITDGAPTHVGSSGPDKPADADELIKAIHQRTREVNFLRGVRIFTLGFPEAEEEFLKKLAADNSGSYAPIR